MPVSEEAPRRKPINVSHKTIAEMRRIGMDKAIERANSGDAGDEFVEGARRMYGKRINPKQKTVTPKMQESLKQTNVQAPPKGAETSKPSKVYKEPKKPKNTWDKTWGRFI